MYLTIINNNFLTWSLQCVRAQTGGGAGLHILAPFPPSYFPTYLAYLSYLSYHSPPHTFLLMPLLILLSSTSRCLLMLTSVIIHLLAPFPPSYFPTYALTYLIIFYLSLPTYAYFCDHPPSCTNPLLILSYLCSYLSHNSLSYLQFSTPYPPLTSHLCLHLIIYYSPTFFAFYSLLHILSYVCVLILGKVSRKK